jgi:hypothetical protein
MIRRPPRSCRLRRRRAAARVRGFRAKRSLCRNRRFSASRRGRMMAGIGPARDSNRDEIRAGRAVFKDCSGRTGWPKTAAFKCGGFALPAMPLSLFGGGGVKILIHAGPSGCRVFKLPIPPSVARSAPLLSGRSRALALPPLASREAWNVQPMRRATQSGNPPHGSGRRFTEP